MKLFGYFFAFLVAIPVLAACTSTTSYSPLLSAEPEIDGNLSRVPRTLRLVPCALCLVPHTVHLVRHAMHYTPHALCIVILYIMYLVPFML